MATLSLTKDGTTSNLRVGPVLLLGAPGVGKGTQAHRLVATFHIPQISTGDLLRDHIRSGTDLGSAAKALMDRGELVPDDVVNRMVSQRLRQPDASDGFILDGFPRTRNQSEWLDTELSNSSIVEPLIAFQIQVPEEELLQRITGRRICSVCQHIYNIYFHPPRVEGVCDVEGAPLLHRSDDTETAFWKRIGEYTAKTAAVIDHYRAHGRFCEIDGTGSVDSVASHLITALRRLRAQDQTDMTWQSK